MRGFLHPKSSLASLDVHAPVITAIFKVITSAIHRKVKRNHSIKCGDYDRNSSHIIQTTLFPGSAKGPDLCVINHPFHTMGCRHRGGYLPPVCLINRLKMCLTERCYKALKRGAKGVCKMAERGSPESKLHSVSQDLILV